MKIMGERIKKELNPDEQILEDIKKENITAYNQVHYPVSYTHLDVYKRQPSLMLSSPEKS